MDLIAVDRGDSVLLRWTDPAGDEELFVVEAPTDGLRRIRAPVEAGAEEYQATDLDLARGYCFWLVLPYETPSSGDAVAISNPACVRGAYPDG
jgi:hypothetical protein